MIESIRKQGQVSIDELSMKQVIALLCLWDTNFAKKENKSFTQMLTRCYKSTPWHKNAPVLYIHDDNKTVTDVPHAFRDLTEREELIIVNAIRNN